jgi:hypothetical protein
MDMQNYKDTNGNLHFLDSTDFEYLLPEGCIAIFDAEADSIRNSVNPVQKAADVRTKRDSMLNSTDWIMSRHRDELQFNKTTTLTEDQIVEVGAFREDLRNITAAPNFPDIDWPITPDFVDVPGE